MGVPAFFKHLIDNHDVLRSKFPDDHRFYSLYIDANCLFHPVCFDVMSSVGDNTSIKISELQYIMFIKIAEYIDYLIDYVKPTNLIYIGVDGVAPLAKIRQQRVRRFSSSNNYKNAIMKKNGILYNDIWSNITISPGTQFMNSLHLFLEKNFDNIRKSNPNRKIIYSSYLEPGEGEHKIIQHIKKEFNSNNHNYNNVIYGLDADLIFLSLSSGIPNLYLLRESSEFNSNNSNNENENEKMIYVDMNATIISINNQLSELINSDIPFKTVKNNLPKKNFIKDYVFICYLLGNDFLPHLPSIDINTNGMTILFSVYANVYKKYLSNLIIITDDDIYINFQMLADIIKIISSKEEFYFREILPKHIVRHFNKSFKPKKIYVDDRYESIDRELWNYENLKNISINDTIKLGFGSVREWKTRYYNEYFHCDFTSINIDDVCKSYIDGLIWVAKYYFFSCHDWRWQYKYTHAPFLSDIAQCLIKFISSTNKKIYSLSNSLPYSLDNNDKINEPINIFTQLVSIIPPAFSDVLPVELKNLVCSYKSPIIDMYPMNYKIDMINKTKFYKCIPLIPYLDIERVENAVLQINIDLDNFYHK
jgi:5'-3' exonuclease